MQKECSRICLNTMKGKMNIPFHRPYVTKNEINAVIKSLRSGWLTMGHETVEFEEN